MNDIALTVSRCILFAKPACELALCKEILQRRWRFGLQPTLARFKIESRLEALDLGKEERCLLWGLWWLVWLVPLLRGGNNSVNMMIIPDGNDH